MQGGEELIASENATDDTFGVLPDAGYMKSPSAGMPPDGRTEPGGGGGLPLVAWLKLSAVTVELLVPLNRRNRMKPGAVTVPACTVTASPASATRATQVAKRRGRCFTAPSEPSRRNAPSPPNENGAREGNESAPSSPPAQSAGPHAHHPAQ